MQGSMLTAAVCCALFAANAPADQTPDYINDSQVQARFVKGMSKLLEDKKTADTAELARQLKAESTCDVDLPTARGGASYTPAQVYQRAGDSVLCFGNIYKCGKCNKWHAALAGGVVLSEDGVAVTNYHVMDNDKAGAFGAITRDGRVLPVTEVLASSKAADAAIVRLDASGLTPAPLSVNDPVGTPVCAITHPTGRFYTLTTGVISRYYMNVVRAPAPPSASPSPPTSPRDPAAAASSTTPAISPPSSPPPARFTTTRRKATPRTSKWSSRTASRPKASAP